MLQSTSAATSEQNQPHLFGHSPTLPLALGIRALSNSSFLPDAGHQRSAASWEADRAGLHDTALAPSPALAHSLMNSAAASLQQSLPNPADILATLPGWIGSSEGNLAQPQSRALAGSALQSMLLATPADTHDGLSSSGSFKSLQNAQRPAPTDAAAAAPAVAQLPAHSSSGEQTRQRAKRQASKHAQRDDANLDSPAESDLAQSVDESAQQHPEADHKFEQILLQTSSGQLPTARRQDAAAPRQEPSGLLQTALRQDAAALKQKPSAHNPAVRHDIRQLQKELSLKHDLLITKHSSSRDSPAAASHSTAATLTLDEALESINPSHGFPWGFPNPFAGAAEQGTWQMPTRAEGASSQQQGPNGNSSDVSASCHQVCAHLISHLFKVFTPLGQIYAVCCCRHSILGPLPFTEAPVILRDGVDS